MTCTWYECPTCGQTWTHGSSTCSSCQNEATQEWDERWDIEEDPEPTYKGDGASAEEGSPEP